MRQQSREHAASTNLQRTGLSVLSQPVPQPSNSTVRSLGYDSMTINRPVFSQTAKPPQYNYSQYYGAPADERYRYSQEPEYQPRIIGRNPEEHMIPQYQSVDQYKKPIDLRPYEQNRSFVSGKHQMYDQLSSLAQKHNEAQKTPEQIVNEFKAYTLPKLRLKRFIKMQALMRGHYVRRFKIPRLKERLRMYNLIAESFLRSAINDRIIPDIVMEVIANNKYNQDLSLYSDKHRVFLRYIDDMLGRVVKKLAREVVKEQTDYLVTSILNRRHQDKPQAEKDPFKMLTLVLIGRFIEKEVFIVAKECIREMSLDYYKDLQYTQVIKETLIPNTVRYVVFESLDEIIIERYLDGVISNLTKELANPLASHMYELIVAEQESHSLDQALQNYMYRMMGDILLEHLLLQMQDEQLYDQVVLNKDSLEKVPIQPQQQQQPQQQAPQPVQTPQPEPPADPKQKSYTSDFGEADPKAVQPQPPEKKVPDPKAKKGK